MKIAQLCLSPDKGGLELYVRQIVLGLHRRKVECVALVAPGSKIEALLREDGLPYRTWRVFFRWFPCLAAWRLARWLEAERIDVLHVHWGKDLSLVALACRFVRRPVRLVYSRQMAITRPKYDWYHRFLYRRVDLLLAITQRLQHEARRFLPMPAERVQLLYYGVPTPAHMTSEARPEQRAHIGIPPDRFAVGLFGRIEPSKGQHVLIEACALLKQRGMALQVSLFGQAMTPAYMDELRELVRRLALDGQVRFHGFHPRPTEIMGCFDAVVLTTYNETFGLVLIEAMRAGVAVIGTDAGGVPEIIAHGETGLLVPPRDPVALANAIEQLVRDPALRVRLAAAGKASADARFDEEHHFSQLMEILRDSPRVAL